MYRKGLRPLSFVLRIHAANVLLGVTPTGWSCCQLLAWCCLTADIYLLGVNIALFELGIHHNIRQI